MSKLVVVSDDAKTRIPFLRGILTRSLQESGLPFKDAYRIATAVRDELAEQTEIPAGALRQLVEHHLAHLGPAVMRRYRNRQGEAKLLLVKLEEGRTVPFSRGQHRADFEACGLRGVEAAQLAQRLMDELSQRPAGTVDLRELRRVTYDLMLDAAGVEAASRYVGWLQFHKSDRPLIVMLGGTAGTGKSSIASNLAHRLEIVRSQSTDMLREVMRMMIPDRLLPVLHASSFAAWRDLPSAGDSPPDQEALLARGYLTQTELLAVAVEAVVQRSIRERVSLILEGVHVHPLLLDRIPKESDAIVVPILLAVLERDELKARIRGRGRQAPARRARRYLDHFDDIWRLQTFLLAEADRAGMHIVANQDKDRTNREVMGLVMDALRAAFSGNKEDAFA